MRSREQALLHAYWDRVYSWARRRSRLTPLLRLKVGCRTVSVRRAYDARAFMHTGHRPGTVCAVPQAARLAANFIVGLFLHEIGHPLSWRLWRRSDQWDADDSVLEVYRIRLRYQRPLLLEWVPDAVVRKILGGDR